MKLLEKFLEKALLPEYQSDGESEIQALGEAASSLFGVERFARESLERRTSRVKSDVKFLNQGWRRLSIKPLGWTRGIIRIRPAFSMFRVDNHVMSIAGSRVTIPNEFPEPLQKAFAPALDLNQGTLTTMFRGVLPKETKETIKKAAPLFEQYAAYSGVQIPHLYLLCEETEWGREGKPQNPILVGWDGTDLWLIESYVEPMTFDEFMQREFPDLRETSKVLSLPAYNPLGGSDE